MMVPRAGGGDANGDEDEDEVAAAVLEVLEEEDSMRTMFSCLPDCPRSLLNEYARMELPVGAGEDVFGIRVPADVKLRLWSALGDMVFGMTAPTGSALNGGSMSCSEFCEFSLLAENAVRRLCLVTTGLLMSSLLSGCDGDCSLSSWECECFMEQKQQTKIKRVLVVCFLAPREIAWK